MPTAAARASVPDDFVGVVRRAVEAGEGLEISTSGATHRVQGEAAEAVLDAIASGRHVDVTALPEHLTTGQAAGLLGVRRPTVVALVDSGKLPASKVNTHRRIETTDLLAFRERRRQASAVAMDELVRVSEELGLYDE